MADDHTQFVRRGQLTAPAFGIMLSSFFSSLDGWAWVALVGAIIVVPGVILESAECIVKWGEKRRFLKVIRFLVGPPTMREYMCAAKTLKRILLPVESLGFAILIIGLVVEIWGGFRSDEVQSRQNAELRIRAALMESNNLVLQSKLAPRRITMEQMTNFIALVKFVPKIPITIDVSGQGFDTADFGLDIRRMLDEAGFKTNSDSGQFGINWNPLMIRNDFGSSNVDVDVLIAANIPRENMRDWFPDSNFFSNAAYLRVLFGRTNDFMVYNAISGAMNQVGIRVFWAPDPDLKTNQCAIVVPLKP